MSSPAPRLSRHSDGVTTVDAECTQNPAGVIVVVGMILIVIRGRSS